MSQVDEVRSAADIVKIVGDYVKLRKAGANFVGLCPFHQEKTPSFAVHPVKQIFHCFGCGVGGDVFKFVMQIENLTFPEALRRVAEKTGVRLRETFSDETYDANAKIRAGLYKLHEAAEKFFSAQLSGTTEGRLARAYLADRGLADEVVARFRLGYAPADGQGLTRHLAGMGFEAEVLDKSGLVLYEPERRRHYDRFRRRIIFPIAQDTGKVVAFAGRALGDEQPKYLNSPETPIYVKGRVLYHLDRGAAAIRKLDYAILVEGYMDCIAVASSGIENVVASCGTSLTEAQVRLLSRATRRVVVNYDPDSAGVAATERSLAILLEAGFEAKVLALPGGLDPDSFIRQKGPAAYRERLASAPAYLDYLTERAINTHDVTRPEGKVAAANAVLPYVAKVPSPLLRAELANRLAERLRLDERLLRDELRRAAGAGEREVRSRPELAASKATAAEKELLQALLEDDRLADELLPQIVSEGMAEGSPTGPIFKRYLELRSNAEKKFEIAELEQSLTPEARAVLYESLFWPVKRPEQSVEGLLGHLRALRAMSVRQRLEALKKDLVIAVEAREWSKVRELEEAKSRLENDLRGIGEGKKISIK